MGTNTITRLMLHATLLTFLVAASIVAAPDRPGRPTEPQAGIRSRPPAVTAITNAKIVVSPTQTIDKGMMIIENGVIRAVGPNLTIPTGAVVIDMSGKTLYPGIVDPVTNYGLEPSEGPATRRFRGGDDGPQPRGTIDGASSWNDAVHAAREWVHEFKHDPAKADEWLAQGFTTVQSARMDGIFRGTGFVTLVSKEIETSEAVLDPDSEQYLSFDKGTSKQDFPQSLMGSIALLRQTFLDRDWYRECEAAVAKYPGTSMPEVNNDLAALARYNGPFIFDSDDDLSLLRAAKIAQEFQIPFFYIGSNLEYARIDESARLKSPIILPLNFPKAPGMATPQQRTAATLADMRFWERAPRNARVVDSAGIPFAFTSYRLKEKGEYLTAVRKTVGMGLSTSAALRAMTIAPAQLIGADKWVGTLEKGKFANFIVTDGDLFVDSTLLLSVWVKGRQEKVITEDEVFAIHGRFTLNGWTKPLTLDIKTDRPMSTKISAGGSKFKVDKSSKMPDRVSAIVNLDSLGGSGIGSLELRKVGSSYIASIIDGTGKVTPLTVTSEATIPAEAESESKEEAKTDSLDAEDKEKPGQTRRGWRSRGEKKSSKIDSLILSRLTYPNVAFGVEKFTTPQNVLVKNATIWTADKSGKLENSDLLVLGGKISKIGKNLTAPGGVMTIDGTGKHLTPGIIDEHSHICISEGVNDAGMASSAIVRIGDVVNSDDIAMYRALAGGVTTIQQLHGSANPIGGQAQVIKLKWGLAPDALKFTAAPPSIKFALGENVKQSNWGDRNTTRYPQTRMGVESFHVDKFQSAKEYMAARAAATGKGAKPGAGQLPVRRDLELECLGEILAGQRFIHCHSYVQSEILALMRVAESFNFKIHNFTHILEGYKVATEMAKHGATASAFSDWWAYKFEVYESIPQAPGLMHQAGVITSINSDSNEMMRRLNQEAAKSIKYTGMDPLDALKLATINPAIQLKVDSRVGSLVEGKDADFVIWSGNPLSMMSKVEQTWIEGSCYFSLEKDIAAREANRIEREKLVQKILALEEDSGGNGPSFDQLKETGREFDCEDAHDEWHDDELDNSNEQEGGHE